MDLSSPKGASVNNEVYEHLCSLKYASVDDVIGIIIRGSLMAKVDVRKAYRNIQLCISRAVHSFVLLPVDTALISMLAVSVPASIFVKQATDLTRKYWSGFCA